MKKLFLVLSMLLMSFTSWAQDFNTTLSSIVNDLKTVETKDTEYIQSIEQVEPGIVKITIAESSLKNGKTTTTSMEFNFADIDINTIRTITDKDIIQVQLLANNKQELVKTLEDNEKISYEDELYVYAKNIDNGRLLEEHFKTAVGQAIKINEKRLSLTSYQEHINWLTSQVTDANLIKKQYAQKLEEIAEHKGKLELTVTENSGSKSTTNVYQFNLNTLNPNSIVFSISGEEFSVEMETAQKLDVIKHFKDGEQQNYTDGIEIICDNVELAKDLQKVLKGSIPLAKEAFENSMAQVQGINQGIQQLNATTQKIDVEDVSVTQSISGDCVITLEQTITDSKKSTTNVFHFNLKDINKNSINYTTKSKFVFLEIETTAGNKFIKVVENDELQNYTDDIVLYCPEVEDAMQLRNNLFDLINRCNNLADNTKTLSKETLHAQLTENIKKVNLGDDAYEQTFTIKDDGNSVAFKSLLVKEKSSEEHIFEFNLSDINPSSVKMETSGKDVVVTAATYYLEKIIKFYEDGEIGNYQNEIEIHAVDIENARAIANYLKHSVGK